MYWAPCLTLPLFFSPFIIRLYCAHWSEYIAHFKGCTPFSEDTIQQDKRVRFCSKIVCIVVIFVCCLSLIPQAHLIFDASMSISHNFSQNVLVNLLKYISSNNTNSIIACNTSMTFLQRKQVDKSYPTLLVYLWPSDSDCHYIQKIQLQIQPSTTEGVFTYFFLSCKISHCFWHIFLLSLLFLCSWESVYLKYTHISIRLYEYVQGWVEISLVLMGKQYWYNSRFIILLLLSFDCIKPCRCNKNPFIVFWSFRHWEMQGRTV